MKIERQKEWSDEVSGLLVNAMVGDPLSSVVTLKKSVEEGTSGLFIVRENDRVTGAFVLRPEEAEKGSELVVVAAASQSGKPMAANVVSFITDLACHSDFDYVRVHIPDERWSNVLVGRYGFVPVETVLRKRTL